MGSLLLCTTFRNTGYWTKATLQKGGSMEPTEPPLDPPLLAGLATGCSNSMQCLVSLTTSDAQMGVAEGARLWAAKFKLVVTAFMNNTVLCYPHELVWDLEHQMQPNIFAAAQQGWKLKTSKLFTVKIIIRTTNLPHPATCRWWRQPCYITWWWFSGL